MNQHSERGEGYSPDSLAGGGWQKTCAPSPPGRPRSTRQTRSAHYSDSVFRVHRSLRRASGSRQSVLVLMVEVRRGPTQKSIWRQGIEIASLRLDPGFSIGEYYAYGFAARSCGPAEISRYAPNRWHWERQIPALNDPDSVPVVRNKLLCYRHCTFHGLSVRSGVGRQGALLGAQAEAPGRRRISAV